jgi:hypothetical protein
MSLAMPEVEILALLDTLDPWTIAIESDSGEIREQECFPTYATRGLERKLVAVFRVEEWELEITVVKAKLTSPHGDDWTQVLYPQYMLAPGDSLEITWMLG